MSQTSANSARRAGYASVLPSVLAVGCALAAVLADEPARLLVARDAPHTTDAALVLAGDPDYERTRTGARLVLAGQARLLVLTGGEPGPGDSATSLRDVALAMGVPERSIRMEQVSTSTHESLVAIRDILAREHVKSLALVTSPYHQRRASWAAKRTLRGIAVFDRPADPSSWRPDGWWKTTANRRIVLGEYLKLAYYILRGWA